MKILEIPTDIVYCVGDLHGEFNAIEFNIKRFELENCVIVFCGDIGMGFNNKEFYKQTFNKISRTLSVRNIHLVFIRGNHDDPSYFSDKCFRFKRIHLIPDYTLVKTRFQNILCVGGGVSIDRTLRISENQKQALLYKRYHQCTTEEAERKARKCYWSDEMPMYNEQALEEFKENNIFINTVCTHTCPSFCQPRTKDGIQGWLLRDDNLEEDLETERRIMDEIYNKLINDGHPLKNWVYGHYHWHNREFTDITYTLLDMCRNGGFDMIEIKNEGED